MSNKIKLEDITALVDLLNTCFSNVKSDSDLLFVLATMVLDPLRSKLCVKMFGHIPYEGIRLKLKPQEVLALLAIKPYASAEQDNAIVRIVRHNNVKK